VLRVLKDTVTSASSVWVRGGATYRPVLRVLKDTYPNYPLTILLAGEQPIDPCLGY